MKSLNFQSVVSQFFEYESTVVVRWPLPFIIIPPLLTVSIVTLTVTNFHLNVTNDTLQVFLPDDMRSLRDLKELIHLFPPRDTQRDTYSIFGTKFVYTVIEDEQPEGNILSSSGIQRMARLHKFVMGLETRQGDNVATNCLRNRDDEACTMHPIAFALEDSTPEFAIQFLLRYPNLKFGDFVVDNAMVFGGVEVVPKSQDIEGNSPIRSSKAVRMTYILEASESTERWIDLFLTTIPRYKESNSTVLWSSSKSLAKEMERNGELLIPWMPWTSLVLVVFCMFACSSFHVVKSQPFIGFFAMFNATMATIASTSLLIYIQYPFLPLVFIMPFLVVSIGTDNMFLMLKSWRMTKKSANEERRYICALTESAASLFLTSLTDGLSFAIGSISDFHAVRVFCTYCAMAILFMFLFQVTFFNAVMSLCCRREVAGKHPVFCCYDTVPSNETKILKPNSDTHSDIASIVAKYLYRILNPWPSRIVVFCVFLLYLFTSIHYAIGLPLGLDLKLLAPDDSYVSRELEAQEKLFADYGGFCFALVRSENISFRDPMIRRDLIKLYHDLGGSEYASPAEFWLEPFEKKHRGRKYSESNFSDELHTFLAKEPNLKFRNDIRFTMTGRIEAIKMMFRVRKLGKDNDSPRAEYMRRIMETSQFSGFVYDTSFLLVDQQMTTVYNVIIDVVSAILTMLSICVLMVPRPVSAMCIAFAILSVNIGVIGALAATNTRLDIISMITIVMSVGFSVDYVTHTTFHFVIQRDNRLEVVCYLYHSLKKLINFKKCLLVMTEPILQSALSTAIGVSLLSFVHSYIVRTFVNTVFFVVGLGILHGLIFLPVLLDTIVPHSEYMIAYEPHQEEEENNHYEDLYGL
ncbi:Protein CBR-PTR-9 [Caenorhabditis briggsae]|uniref:Protein CBR-PTR-9 n=1 Tax=Caenorhabditis briggsae TaxID=6238 RepID=A8X342_CAEBR|nr:Protein CBR-PTR-9 [Caenorhabditis briggsae]CAP27052.1 Protein CBR-PTR-9 [Caenorhabditis briggsae]